MFTAILWDYDGTLANTPVKNIAVTRAVLGRLDPALLDPAAGGARPPWPPIRRQLPLAQLAELYQHALRVPANRLDEAGALWGPCQRADGPCRPSSAGFWRFCPVWPPWPPWASAPRTTAATSAPPWPLTARRTALPPWWATRTWTSPVEAGPRRLPGLPGPAGASGGALRLHRGPRRGHRLRPQCPGGPAGHGPGGGGGLRGRRARGGARPWIWRRRTPWAARRADLPDLLADLGDTTAALLGRRGCCLPAGGFCLCFVFWCAMIF